MVAPEQLEPHKQGSFHYQLEQSNKYHVVDILLFLLYVASRIHFVEVPVLTEPVL